MQNDTEDEIGRSLFPFNFIHGLRILISFDYLHQSHAVKISLGCFWPGSPGSENIPVEKSSAPRFETWNGSRDPSETNLAWLDFLNMGQFCAIDHALF